MERPSHNNFRISHSPATRLPSVGLAISLPFAILWALSHHNVANVFIEHGPLIVERIAVKVKPLPPPPLPPLSHIAQPKDLLPPIPMDPARNPDDEQAFVPPLPPKAADPGQTMPDRAAAGILATHTTPAYPLVSLRLGEEGVVTLRLTVRADGHVGAAEIVTSSGSRRLDEAAREWVLAHWLYRPALVQGQAAASQVSASVVFSLKDQH